ncbi:DNA polymerase III subunit chi [Thauera chlorobenzoica]|uniref:DNA polymerase III chi subunit n=1 Tax=Thauera chlorobenzoica TaxID=96773 RepID=A0A1H5SHU2_9RHOO|nr:DNA polymerase III subunit chi [Thauera chlorobenzoica]APR04792.1 DNA polymerase III chi subunit [Thauera chlorobenzoica]SEF49994.1 DNA polymerase III, chi subunit [Thauera chlorobenzoica]
MPPRVRFYHNAPDRLVLALELVGRAYASGRKVAVRLVDAEELRRFDQALWTSEPLAFVPHVALASALAGETPVVLAAAGEDAGWPHADLLFNLADDLPPGHERFRTVVEIVGQGEAHALPARARWTEYRRRGLELKAFDAASRTAL